MSLHFFYKRAYKIVQSCVRIFHCSLKRWQSSHFTRSRRRFNGQKVVIILHISQQHLYLMLLFYNIRKIVFLFLKLNVLFIFQTIPRELCQVVYFSGINRLTKRKNNFGFKNLSWKLKIYKNVHEFNFINSIIAISHKIFKTINKPTFE